MTETRELIRRAKLLFGESMTMKISYWSAQGPRCSPSWRALLICRRFGNADADSLMQDLVAEAELVLRCLLLGDAGAISVSARWLVMQVTTSCARIKRCSGSPNLTYNSIVSEFPQATSRVTSRADPKHYPPLIPDTVPSETEKGHWIEEVSEGLYGTRRETMLHLLACNDLEVGRKLGKDTSTLCLHNAPPVKNRPRQANLSAGR